MRFRCKAMQRKRKIIVFLRLLSASQSPISCEIYRVLSLVNKELALARSRLPSFWVPLPLDLGCFLTKWNTKAN